MTPPRVIALVDNDRKSDGCSLPLAAGVHVDHAPLACSISHVVGVCAEKEMVRSDTWRVVAVMADEQAIRDRSVGQFPGHTVRVRPSLAIPESAVASWAPHCPGPWPTSIRIRLVNLRPEPRSDVSEWASVTACSRAETRRGGFHGAGSVSAQECAAFARSEKRTAAPLTRQWDTLKRHRDYPPDVAPPVAPTTRGQLR